jgi:glycosyltransferase involved in cell wall biosynthesis
VNPPVSILLLTYNQEKYISQAIISVLNQNVNFEYEILIGEDCSTDKTREIVEGFAKNNPEKIKLFLSKDNIGPLRNEKQLIEQSKGKYLAFLEGDDYWTDVLKLQKQYDFMEAHPDYGLVHGDVDHYYENSGKTESRVNKLNGKKIPQGYIFNELLKPDPLFIKTATTFFRKDVIVNHFDYNLAVKENWPVTDLALWMDIAYNTKVYYFDEVFATYRLLNESASRTTSPEKKINFLKKLYELKQSYMNKYKCDETTRTNLEVDHYKNLIKMAYNLNNHSLAVESINILKAKGVKITVKEHLMLISTKNKSLRRLIEFIKD